MQPLYRPGLWDQASVDHAGVAAVPENSNLKFPNNGENAMTKVMERDMRSHCRLPGTLIHCRRRVQAPPTSPTRI